jgi:hypothetical protein
MAFPAALRTMGVANPLGSLGFRPFLPFDHDPALNLNDSA